MHYKRAWRRGMQVRISFRRDDLSAPLKKRLRSRITISKNGCWEWHGHKKDGYGSVTIKSGEQTAAHRASWTAFNGKIPKDICVLHQCDNRGCINPDHLFLGTRADNNHDRDRKGRNGFKALYGEDSPHHRLTLDQVLEIRKKGTSTDARKELSKKFHVTRGTINDIVSGRRWKIFLEMKRC